LNKPETSKDDIQLLLNRGRELTATNPAKAAFMFEEAFHHAAEKNNYALAGESGKELSAVYFELNEFKKSLSVLQQSISFFEKLKDNDNIIACYEGCIQLHLAHHDYLNVLEILHKCCTIFKEQNKILTLAETYNRIGEIYKLLAEYRNAINYHERALQVFEQANKQEQLSLTYYYIGNCYNWADELDVSYNFLLKSLKIADQLHQPELKLKSLGSLAVLFTKYKDYSRSSDYFFEAIDNANLTGNKQFKSILLKSLGNLYNQMNEPEKAIKVLTEGLEITRELELKIPTDLIHQFLSDSYVMTGDYKKERRSKY
jgi:tetratricopeptide (TPR) repeat protein